MIESNREHGEGRSDIVIKDYAGDRAAVFEIKYAKTLKELAGKCEEAVRRMDDRMYADDFADEYARVVCYGISFYKKRCLLMKKE